MAKQDYGILISQPGSDANGATGNQIILNTSNPFIKIDTQNKAAFQTITLIITTDPPNPTTAFGTRYTVLYQFKHGYAYIPSLETLFYVTSPPPGSSGTMTYFQDIGTIGYGTNQANANLYAFADKTYVYIVCQKQNSPFNDTILLTGTNVTITTHVFLDDIGI